VVVCSDRIIALVNLYIHKEFLNYFVDTHAENLTPEAKIKL
jgi:hypothetical protein